MSPFLSERIVTIAKRARGMRSSKTAVCYAAITYMWREVTYASRRRQERRYRSQVQERRTPPEGHKEHSVHGGVWNTTQGGCYGICARRGSPASV